MYTEKIYVAFLFPTDLCLTYDLWLTIASFVILIVQLHLCIVLYNQWYS